MPLEFNRFLIVNLSVLSYFERQWKESSILFEGQGLLKKIFR